jgi:transposase
VDESINNQEDARLILAYPSRLWTRRKSANLEIMLVKYSKLSDSRLKKLLKCFSEDLTAMQTAEIVSINRNTVNRYYRLFRNAIAAYQEKISNGVAGEIELDESYFGGRNKGRRGRGTAKIPVFGILKRNGRVYTQIIRNAKRSEIQPIIKQFVRSGSTVYTDKWRAYDGLVLDGYKHYRINHQKNEFSNRKGNHINGIENFWSYAKRRLQKFNGIATKNFYFHLKECEFRYNERKNVYQKLLSIFKDFLV